MRVKAPRRANHTAAARNVAAEWVVPIPTPPVPPENANVVAALLLATGAVAVVFDRAVIVDFDNPPQTWVVNGSGNVNGGGTNFGGACVLTFTLSVSQGNQIVFGPNDPAARTADGGYVNGGTVAISGL